MPPKETQGGRGRGGRGGPRGGGGGERGGGGGRGRGGGGGGGGGRGGGPASGAGGSAPAGHLETVGIKRPSYGRAGNAIRVRTNLFEMKLDSPIIHHYDAIVPDKVLPIRLMRELYQALKAQHPQVFGTSAYDGRKNLYSAIKFPFENDSQEYQITLDTPPAGGVAPGGREPKMWRIRLTKTHQEINPEVLRLYVEGQQSHSPDVTVAINALNVAAQMLPGDNPKFTPYGKSVLIPDGSINIGRGLALWRGYFQSIRPTIGKMVANVDITTALMHKPGSLMDIMLEFLGKPPKAYQALDAPMNDAERCSVTKFLFRLRITTTHIARPAGKSRGIVSIKPTSAATTKFVREGKTETIQQYFESTYRKKLKYPKAVLVEIGPETWLPIEICEIIPGQPRRAQPPSDLTKAMVEFATKKPAERLADIRLGLQRLGYGQSGYLRALGAQVLETELVVPARLLLPPKLVYSGNKTMSVVPGTGQWNMGNNKFYTSGQVKGWGILIFARPDSWPQPKVMEVTNAFSRACSIAGITGFSGQGNDPVVEYGNPQRPALQSLQSLGIQHKKLKGALPQFVLVVIPPNSTDLYTQIKHFGDVKHGIATQCVLETKLYKRGPQGYSINGAQYFNNVALKVNVKLGGINVVPNKMDTHGLLGDNTNLTLVMGADAAHPPPGTEGRPSYTAVIGSVDNLASKYVATSRAQQSKREIIEDMQEMTEEIIKQFQRVNQGKLPKKIIMYRDGVSEGQFQQVIDLEIPKIHDACKKFNFTERPKLTFIVVGKRHHNRFFPETASGGDRSGNCLAGTVIDQAITHPVEYDWYLLSHAGLLGTSRPAHYSVLVDENNMSPDVLQQFTYALCHVYARCTRSVSIPAPTYYADIVCERSANHYEPGGAYRGDDSSSQASGSRPNVDARDYFQQANELSKTRMYFC
ncbi:hypothetical protein FRB95_001180 [Tulasnella sp. JGI-2019a]|nr:hypothetical protein FRB93_008926 [Tulasnella sp. JGI-2019a]KAG9032594.1 hypothetical protein FRB95_001180 [Tulasnella sp. JGI-2019a]